MNAKTSLLLLLVSAYAGHAQQAPSSPPAPEAPVPQANSAPPQSAGAPLPDSPDTVAPAVPLPTGPTAVFDTSMGQMRCRLYQKQAPETVAGFIGLATGTRDWTNPVTHRKEHGKPLYDGTTFHRVIPGFMAQGGDPAGDGTGDPGFTLPDEIVPNLGYHVPGRFAKATSGPGTDGSQFFITEKPYPSLTGSYTIFGQCDPESVTVVEAITHVERDAEDKPLTPVTLSKVTIVPAGQPVPAPPAAPSSAPASSTPR